MKAFNTAALWAMTAAAVLSCAGSPGAVAAGPDDGEKVEAGGSGFQALPDAPTRIVDSITIDGEEIWFRAEAGTMAISRDERDAAARLFYVSYRKLDGEPGKSAEGEDEAPVFADAGERPITFSFNGGPGSSSVWLHLGLFGPYRVGYSDDVGHAPPPPYGLIANAYSLLDKSDFVFIDPVSTGFSRTEKDVRADGYHGVEGDIESVGMFIQQYLSRTGRWASPKFIAGESYGTTRAAGLSEHLWSRHGIGLNGVVLISSVLNFQTIRFGSGNDLPCILYLPNFAATAYYHGALSDELQAMPVEDLVAEVEEFATGEYATYLMRNADASAELRADVIRRVAMYTGMSPDYVERANLRVSMPGFCKELLRSEGVTVGRLDSRFTGFDRDGVGDSNEFDPSYSTIYGAYTAGLNHLVRERLGFETDLPYEILTGRVHPWSYDRGGENRYLDVGERLRSAMVQQPHMRVFNAAGYYDLATPSAAAEYTFARTLGDERIRDRITFEHYEAGHMMYVHKPSLEKLRADLAAFYDGAIE